MSFPKIGEWFQERKDQREAAKQVDQYAKTTGMELSPAHREALIRRHLLQKQGEVRSEAGYVLRYNASPKSSEGMSPEKKALQKKADHIAIQILSKSEERPQDYMLMALQSLSPEDHPQYLKVLQFIEKKALKNGIPAKELEAALYRNLFAQQNSGDRLIVARKSTREIEKYVKSIVEHSSDDSLEKMYRNLSILRDRINTSDRASYVQAKTAQGDWVRKLLKNPNLTPKEAELFANKLSKALRKKFPEGFDQKQAKSSYKTEPMPEFSNTTPEQEDILSPEELIKMIDQKKKKKAA